MRSRLWPIATLTVILLVSLACNLGAVPTLAPTNVAAPTTDLGGSAGFGETPGPTAPPVNGAACTPRTDWPTMVIADGDTLSGISQRTGASIDGLVAANCLSNAASIIAGQTLYVPVVPAGSGGTGNTGGGVYVPTSVDSGSNSVPSNCGSGDTWFFIFAFGATENACPGPVITVNAIGQNFQNGRVYRYDAAPGETQAMIYVTYNDFTWESFPDTADPSQASTAIARLLQQQPALSARLGWSYAPQEPFTGRRQAPAATAGYIYVDHSLRKLVLRLNDSPRTWVVVGYYQ